MGAATPAAAVCALPQELRWEERAQRDLFCIECMER